MLTHVNVSTIRKAVDSFSNKSDTWRCPLYLHKHNRPCGKTSVGGDAKQSRSFLDHFKRQHTHAWRDWLLSDKAGRDSSIETLQGIAGRGIKHEIEGIVHPLGYATLPQIEKARKEGRLLYGHDAGFKDTDDECRPITTSKEVLQQSVSKPSEPSGLFNKKLQAVRPPLGDGLSATPELGPSDGAINQIVPKGATFATATPVDGEEQVDSTAKDPSPSVPELLDTIRDEQRRLRAQNDELLARQHRLRRQCRELKADLKEVVAKHEEREDLRQFAECRAAADDHVHAELALQSRKRKAMHDSNYTIREYDDDADAPRLRKLRKILDERREHQLRNPFRRPRRIADLDSEDEQISPEKETAEAKSMQVVKSKGAGKANARNDEDFDVAYTTEEEKRLIRAQGRMMRRYRANKRAGRADGPAHAAVETQDTVAQETGAQTTGEQATETQQTVPDHDMYDFKPQTTAEREFPVHAVAPIQGQKMTIRLKYPSTV